MKKIMLVGGKGVDKLSDFLRQRDTIELTYSCASLAANLDNIVETVIRVDTLVIMYRDNTYNMRKEMEALQKLLSSKSSFFRVQDILFIYKECEETEVGLKYFKTVVKDIDISIKYAKHKKQMTFQAAYDAIIGTSGKVKIKTTYKKQYRVAKGEDIKNTYEPNSNLHVVEPFTEEHLINFGKSKELAKATSSNVNISDNEKDSGVHTKYYEPDLEYMDIKDISNIVLVSGFEKSGVSTLCSALTEATLSNAHSVAVINLSPSNSISNYFKQRKIQFNEFKLADVVTNKVLKAPSNLTYINLFNHKAFDRVLGMKYIFNRLDKINPDLIYVDCPFDLLRDVTNILKSRLLKVALCLETLESDVVRASVSLYPIKDVKYCIFLKDISLPLEVENEFGDFDIELDVKRYTSAKVKNILAPIFGGTNDLKLLNPVVPYEALYDILTFVVGGDFIE